MEMVGVFLIKFKCYITRFYKKYFGRCVVSPTFYENSTLFCECYGKRR